MLQDVEHLEHHHPATWRRVAGDLVAAIVGPQWLAASRAVGGQILSTEQSTVGLYVLTHLARHFAVVELVRTADRQPLQAVGHVRVEHPRARAFEFAVRIEIELAPGRAQREFLARLDPPHVGLGPELVDVRPHREALARVANRRCEHIGPRQAPVFTDRLVVGQQAARDHDRLVADLVDATAQLEAETIAKFALDEVLPHGLGDRRRRAGVEIQKPMHALVGQVQVQAAETRDARHAGIDHALHQRAGDRRVDRVTALHQRDGPGFHRLGLRRDDHSVGHLPSTLQ